MSTSYSERFQHSADVADYESKEYGAGSYSSFIWNLQRPILEKTIKEFCRLRNHPVRLLDFACGTGRVISALEPLVGEAAGVDISANMVERARTKCHKASLRVGDILVEPELLGNNYDVITSFRFLLNVEPGLRRGVLKQLRGAIRTDGLLLVNVHGSSHSLRHPAIVWRRWRERSRPTNAMLNEMSPAETRRLLRDCGFQIVRQFGFGMLPPTIYRTPLRPLAETMDRSLAGENILKHFSIDRLLACRPV